MFAPNHHSAMRYVAPVRRSLGFRSIFNILGPLTNPAGAANQLLGVFHIDLCGILSRVLQQLGSKHVLVVCGEGGLDEITLTGKTRVAELKESLQKMNEVLDGKAAGAARDIVVLNAAAALYAGNMVASLADGVKAAQEAIDSGKAKAKKDEFIEFGKQFA